MQGHVLIHESLYLIDKHILLSISPILNTRTSATIVRQYVNANAGRSQRSMLKILSGRACPRASICSKCIFALDVHDTRFRGGTETSRVHGGTLFHWQKVLFTLHRSSTIVHDDRLREGRAIPFIKYGRVHTQPTTKDCSTAINGDRV